MILYSESHNPRKSVYTGSMSKLKLAVNSNQKQTKKSKNLMKYLENKNNITYNKKEVYNRRKGEKQIWKILQVIY